MDTQENEAVVEKMTKRERLLEEAQMEFPFEFTEATEQQLQNFLKDIR